VNGGCVQIHDTGNVHSVAGAKTKGLCNGDDDQMGMFSFRCKCAREASKVKKDITIDVRALAIL
jgi:hypothetical protein